MIKCKHSINFHVHGEVSYIEDTDRHVVDIRVTCSSCGKKFIFLGLPAGMDYDGAAVSIDGVIGRFGIAPEGKAISELEGTPSGYTVRKAYFNPVVDT